MFMFLGSSIVMKEIIQKEAIQNFFEHCNSCKAYQLLIKNQDQTYNLLKQPFKHNSFLSTKPRLTRMYNQCI